MSTKSRRETILDTVDDLVSNFLYYSRKEDEDLRVGQINEAVTAGEITEDEIVEAFRKHLHAGLSS